MRDLTVSSGPNATQPCWMVPATGQESVDSERGDSGQGRITDGPETAEECEVSFPKSGGLADVNCQQPEVARRGLNGEGASVPFIAFRYRPVR
jgi:hypothetical protein